MKSTTAPISHTFIFAGLLGATLATVCYQCSEYDDNCEDDYAKPVSHETQCYDLPDTLENGGCSKVKSMTGFAGSAVTQGRVVFGLI